MEQRQANRAETNRVSAPPPRIFWPAIRPLIPRGRINSPKILNMSTTQIEVSASSAPTIEVRQVPQSLMLAGYNATTGFLKVVKSTTSGAETVRHGKMSRDQFALFSGIAKNHKDFNAALQAHQRQGVVVAVALMEKCRAADMTPTLAERYNKNGEFVGADIKFARAVKKSNGAEALAASKAETEKLAKEVAELRALIAAKK